MADDADPDQTNIQLNLDRQTFARMLSFCFVGDIGYDLEDYEAVDSSGFQSDQDRKAAFPPYLASPHPDL